MDRSFLSGVKATAYLPRPVLSPECCPCCSRKVCDWASSRWLSSDAVRLCLCGSPAQVMNETPVRPRKMTECSVLPVCLSCSNSMLRSTCQLWESQSLSPMRALSLMPQWKTTLLHPPTSPPLPPIFPPRHHLIHPPPPRPLPQTLFSSHHRPCLS